jgi:CelD/BcsL family acetyltransferase involved in cellulose biosynthesis
MDSLGESTSAPPFLRPGWIEAWWRAFGAGKLLVLAASEGGAITGVLPIVRRRDRVGSPTNWHTLIFGGICAREEAAEMIAEAFAAMAPPHLRLRYLDARDPLVGALRTNARSIARHQGLSTKGVDLIAEGVLQVLPKIVARRRHAMAT